MSEPAVCHERRSPLAVCRWHCARAVRVQVKGVKLWQYQITTRAGLLVLFLNYSTTKPRMLCWNRIFTEGCDDCFIIVIVASVVI